MKIFFSILVLTSLLVAGCMKSDMATLPELSTASVSMITFNSAMSGGEVISDGKAEVTARGICWSTNSNPTVSDSKTSDGAGIGIFVSDMTGLTSGTTYFVRSYATNKIGTEYGNEISFSTNEPQAATLSTVAVTSIASESAVSGGNISADNGSGVTARGVCWSISTSPTIAGSHSSDGTGTGSFISSLTGLSAGTKYYVRAYATNNIGTGYGDELSFTTNPFQTATLSTVSITAITATTAVSGGNITSDNGSPVTERGVCWSISTNPTIAGSHTSNGTGTGIYVSNLTGLTTGAQYHVRAFATNSMGTAYGNELVFTAGVNPAANEVLIQSFAFVPQTLTVPVNTTVKWTNKDGVPHTVTSDTGLWDSGNIADGGIFNFSFTTVGTFQYHCKIHPEMTGTIIVQ